MKYDASTKQTAKMTSTCANNLLCGRRVYSQLYDFWNERRRRRRQRQWRSPRPRSDRAGRVTSVYRGDTSWAAKPAIQAGPWQPLYSDGCHGRMAWRQRPRGVKRRRYNITNIIITARNQKSISSPSPILLEGWTSIENHMRGGDPPQKTTKRGVVTLSTTTRQ